MKILYLSQYYPPEIGAPAGRVAELSRLWVEAGHQVTVLTGFPNHPTGIVPPEYRRKFRRLAATEEGQGVNIVRTWLLPLPNRRAHERMLNYSSFCLSSAFTGMFLDQPDLVIATSPQLLVGFSGWWLARRKRIPFVFEVRDLWPESLVAVGKGNEDSLLHRSLARVAGFLYRNCGRIVVVTPAFKDHLIEHWRIPENKIHVVENGVDTKMFRSAPPDPLFRRNLGVSGKFVVSYIGTMGNAHGLETMLEAASLLKDEAPNVRFLLLGEGAEKERLVSMARSRALNNLLILGQQPRETIPDFIRASDACLVLLKRTELFKTVLPTKMLEFMSCARPLILGVDGYARQVLTQANAGIHIQPENAADLADAILRLASNPALCQSLGRNGRQHVIQYFSRLHTATKYLDVLQDLLGKNRHSTAAAA